MNSYSILPDLVSKNAETCPSKGALFYKNNGKYVPFSYEELFIAVKTCAAVLKGMGVKRGDTVALLSRNRPEWSICDLGILSMGAVVVPIYPTLGAKDVEYILNDCKATVIIVELDENLKLVESIFDNLSHLHKILVIDEAVPLQSSHAFSYDVQMKNTVPIEAVSSDITPSDLASIVYTSGTTGFPKGVCLSHYNFLSNVEGILQALPLNESDRVLSFLPLSHVFERTAGYYTVLAISGQIYYATDISTVSVDLLDAKPTVVVSVPRLYEKIQAKILDNLKGIKKPIFEWALALGQRLSGTPRENRSGLDALLMRIADRLVYRKIRAKTGGRLRFFVSGGAPLHKDIGSFFDALGILIIEGYGQTETAPVIACNRVEKYIFGSVGKALHNMQIKLTENQELCVKGPNVMNGYHQLYEKTKTIIDEEGWLHTGDVADIDDDGYIFITDRLKDIMVLSNGKNVAPLPIEQAVSMSVYISQIVLIGEQRNFVSALIVPNFEKLTQFSVINNLDRLSLHELLSHQKVHQLFEDELEKYMAPFSHYEKIKKFELMAVEFTIDSGELTPTLKPKRKVIHEVYADVISRMYDM